MSRPSDGLSPRARELLDLERARRHTSPSMKARAFERVSSGGVVGLAALTSKTSAAAVASVGLVKLAAVTVLTIGVGAGVTVALTRAPEAAPAPAPVYAPVASLAPIAPRPIDEPRPIATATATASAEPTAATRPAPIAHARHVPTTTSLEQERRIVDDARAALARGDSAAALAASDEHALRFPDGQLVAEREAIAVRALALAGRTTEARARAERFLRAHPKHVLGEAVRQAAGLDEDRDDE